MHVFNSYFQRFSCSFLKISIISNYQPFGGRKPSTIMKKCMFFIAWKGIKGSVRLRTYRYQSFYLFFNGLGSIPKIFISRPIQSKFNILHVNSHVDAFFFFLKKNLSLQPNFFKKNSEILRNNN